MSHATYRDSVDGRISRRLALFVSRFLSTAALALLLSLSFSTPTAAAPDDAEIVGVPWQGASGITESVAEIMERQRRIDAAAPPHGPPRPIREEFELERHPAPNPDAPAVSQWPPSREPATPIESRAPQPIGVNFLATQINEGPGFIPPDTIGDVGPTQIVVTVNGRIRVFDKAGNPGPLNSDMDNFFNSVRNGAQTSDPHVRYDRLSQRWYIVIINVPLIGGTPNGPNRVLIAMSSGPTITGAGSFTFFQFQQDLPNPGQTNGFADYPTLGVDRFALYVGMNVFNQNGTAFLGTTAYVINKANLIANTLTVTAFRNIGAVNGSGNGPWTPQGVHNDDPNATEGYFIGVDGAVFSILDIRRVSNPGGTPTLSGNIQLVVPATQFPITVPAQGTSTSLDALDDRLFAAAIYRNKLTGAPTLWTAHNFRMTAAGVGSGAGNRDGSRWYEIGSLTTTPTLIQSGTLFDSAASNPRFFWIPSVAMSGQGHMVIGSSMAGTGRFVDSDVAGRLASDPLGTTQTFTAATASSTAYNITVTNPQRWGDFSQTVVDPNNDQTMWTFQEYCNSTNSWGIRVIQLLAPPPATPSSASPASIPVGQASVNVVITGTSSSGSGFFDPGADAGGPGYANHLTAAVNAGVTVNSATFTDPTHVTLNVSTVGATTGLHNVTITNPDGQNATGIGILTVSPAVTTHTVTPSAGAGGSIAPSTPQTVNDGATAMFTLTPNGGFQIANVTGTCGGNLVGNVFTTNPVTADCTVVANFSQITHTVTPSAGAGGSIAPSTPQIVNDGATTNFTLTPNSGFQIANVTGTCGGNLVGNVFTTNPVTADCTVVANFSQITHTVTPSASAGGSIAPSTPQTVNDGATTNFTLTPSGGFQIANVTGTCGGNLVGNVFTTNPVTADCTVVANFSAITHTVTPVAGTGGTIVPSTPQTVDEGDTIAFTVTANAGFAIGSVTGCGGSLVGNTYTTAPITADCTVTASFNPPSHLAGTGGDGQTTAVNTPFASPLSVLVTDTNATPVAGVVVNFTVQPAGNGASAVLSSASAITDASGAASVTATANGTAGSYTVTAAVTGVGETAVFDLTNIVATTDLSIAIDDERTYARYGMTLNYLVTIHNNGPADADDVSVSNAFPPQLDVDLAIWNCLGGGPGTTCTSKGVGPLDDNAVIPADESVSWALSAPVRLDAAGGSVENTVSLSSAGDGNSGNNTATDFDWLVILRAGFELGDDGASAIQPPWLLPVSVPLEQPLTPDRTLTLPLMVQPTGALVDTLVSATANDGHGFRVERLNFGGTRIRAVVTGGEERADNWVECGPDATLVLALVDSGEGWTLQVTGADETIGLPLATDPLRSPSYRISVLGVDDR